ncbi:DUF3772 domain-containing protein [Variovorax dokdonensis]|uniref:DUF3772 domain-containing protein n=1 Tax=Variovorax dokdonensis TaxID=344883 RepID=A0ABT7N6X5_9BURK|nr:DUF3772 domain-containing protein [Variovorax dokdonensis]MDM0043688.1 DUF3772 domain-containing protein [Variovorax dokdonensis]
MFRIRHFIFLLLAALLFAGSASAQTPPKTAAPADAAAPAPAQPAPEITMATLRAQAALLPDTVNADEDLAKLNEVTDQLSGQVERFVAQRTARLADLNARLGELGPAPSSANAEDADVTRQRNALTKERNGIDADIRLARLLAVNAQQQRSELLAERRAVFEAQLFERSETPLRSGFWDKAIAQWPTDRDRLQHLFDGVMRGLSGAGKQWQLGLGALASAAAAVLLLWLLERGLTSVAARFFPAGRLRRSLLALLTVAVYVVVVGGIATLTWSWLEESGDWNTQSTRLGVNLVRLSMYLAFVVGLGRSLLSNARPSWRLPPISDDLAARLGPLPWLMVIATLAFGLPVIVNDVIGAPLNSVLTNLLPTATFMLASLAGLLLMRVRTVSVEKDASPDASAQDRSGASAAASAPTPAERPVWVGLLLGLVAVLLVALVVLVLVGYLAFARVLSGQAAWTGVVVASAYLLFKFADDLWMALLSSRSHSGQRLQRATGIAPQLLDQIAVLLSALSRAAVFFYMLIAFVAPLGSSPGQLLERSGRVTGSLKIGEFVIVPTAIATAVAVLVLGVIGLRLFKRWLENSFLPHTQFEPGMRSSITTLMGYVGLVVVVAFALSALGVGVNRIAWVASALSVGIGFGLQAIVQNFISGLILLAERPVKVGDWVVLDTAEGDIRRINVRATEIELWDRSTLIVPNSEFITKTVRNMTLANPDGRVLIRLPMPLTTDARAARDLMMSACVEHESVLEDPAPLVRLDAVENGLLVFVMIAYVASPRMVAEVRSDLLFAVLDRLQAAQLPLAVFVAQPGTAAAIQPMPPQAVAEPSPTPPLSAAAPTSATAGRAGPGVA